MQYQVYILYSSKFDKFYVGQTDCIQSRLQMHNDGKVKSTKPYKPWQLLHTIMKENRPAAVRLERKLKNLTKKRLREFIEKYSMTVGADVAKGKSAC